MFLRGEEDEAAATLVLIVHVVGESDEADLHVCVAWGVDELCESSFVIPSPANIQRTIRTSREWESLGGETNGNSQSRDVGEP